MGKYVDLTGQKFGKLEVIKKSNLHNKKDKHAYWKCKCDCGNYCIVASHHLKNGNTKSCGCLNNGKSHTRLYRIWTDIKCRCYRKVENSYCYYGGRGITVCDEWLQDFQAFYDWAMTNGYADNLTIDRINNDKGYSPDNCRWVTMKEQTNNRQSNHLITYEGKTQTIAQWAEELNIKQNTLLYRIRRGWSIEEALTKEVMNSAINNSRK